MTATYVPFDDVPGIDDDLTLLALGGEPPTLVVRFAPDNPKPVRGRRVQVVKAVRSLRTGLITFVHVRPVHAGRPSTWRTWHLDAGRYVFRRAS